MSTELLRKAAAEIREDYSAESMGMPTHDPFMYAVADLLDFAAPYGDQPSPQSPTVQHAVTVARAYVGGDERG